MEALLALLGNMRVKQTAFHCTEIKGNYTAADALMETIPFESLDFDISNNGPIVFAFNAGAAQAIQAGMDWAWNWTSACCSVGRRCRIRAALTPSLPACDTTGQA